MDTLLLIGAAVVAGVWLLRHLSTHNRRVCPRCGGTGRLTSGVVSKRYRQCPRCKGTTFVRGWGGRPE